MVKLPQMKNADGKKYINLLLPAQFFLLALLTPFLSASQDTLTGEKSNRVQVHGYIKDLQSFFFTDKPGSLVTGNLIHNRINFRWDITDNFYLRAEARNRLFFGEQVKSTYQFGKLVDNDRGVADLSYNVINDTAVVLNTLLDRLLLNWSKNKWEITLGRQRINWGINLVWNPNDIFNTFNYFDFDYEERPGTDAVRIQYYHGQSSSIELACKLSGKKEEQVAAALYKTNFMGYDIQGLAGVYYEDLVAGAGWAGNAGKTGVKGEASYFHPYGNLSDTSGSVSFTVSFDRTFKHDYFAMASYLYNSKGKSQAGNISALAATTLTAKRLMPFEHSFFVQGGKTISPLVNVSAAIIASPENFSLIVLPSVTISVSDNWELALIAQSFFAEMNAVYRTAGNGVYIRLRWSY